MAQPINNWAEFRKVLRQLKDPKAKERFYTITIDTCDIAYDYCTKYICDNALRSDGGYGVDSISDIPFGKGYGLVSKEFDECLRSIVMMDYGLILISHATDKVFKDEAGVEYNKIVPTLDKRANNIVARMADIIGYSRIITDKDGNEFFTDKRNNLYEDTTKDLNFDELMKNCNNLIKEMIDNNSDEVFKEFYQPRIVQITDRYLGRGQKMSQCSREQVEALSLIYDDLLLLSK